MTDSAARDALEALIRSLELAPSEDMEKVLEMAIQCIELARDEGRTGPLCLAPFSCQRRKKSDCEGSETC